MQKNHVKVTKPSNTFNFSELAEKWPSPLVARDQKQLDRFSGGILCARTLANLDSQGNGPKGRVKIGRKVAYPTISLVEWLERRAAETATRGEG